MKAKGSHKECGAFFCKKNLEDHHFYQIELLFLLLYCKMLVGTIIL